MMTKAEEREALEKIADILEAAGDDSHIGKAFEGCYLIAQENIENDVFDSWKRREEENKMTIQFLAKKIVPDFPVKIQDEIGFIEERLAGDISASHDSFYQSKVGDCTFYRDCVVIDL